MTGSTLTAPTGLDAGRGLAELAGMLPAASAPGLSPALRRHLTQHGSSNKGNFNSFIDDDGNFNSFIGPSR
ncbi:hypothetical protein [Nocardia abscessus]|uniref:hypothetical protein n=1 Tax=Nocardia abscessus TaxID=120957 RepID=UPI002455B1A9|nr:hypothetical protein [Nocardia abscessus]